MQHTCTFCGKADAKLCSGCKSAAYCKNSEKKCQKEDWRTHKNPCSKFQAFKATRPSEPRKLAIRFPPEDTSPELIWVSTIPHNDKCEGLWNEVDFESYFGTDDRAYPGSPVHIFRNDRRNQHLDDDLELYCRDGFLGDGSLPNRSLIQLTQGAMAHPWRGAVVLMALENPGCEGHNRDVTLTDLRNTIDFFIHDGREYAPSRKLTKAEKKEKADGILIACKGDRALGIDTYREITFLKAQLDRGGDQPSLHPALPRLLGVPVITYPILARGPHVPKHTGSDLVNQLVASLHINCDVNSQGQWGRVPMGWQGQVGHVIMVREDGKELTANQAEALCVYCQEVLSPLFEDALAGEDTKESRAKVMESVTPTAFQQFLEDYE